MWLTHLNSNRVLLLAVLVLAGIASYQLFRISPALASAPTVIPRSVEIKETSKDASGASVTTYYTIGTRSDGSHSLTSSIFADDSSLTEHQRYLSFASGIHVIADLVGNVKTSVRKSPETTLRSLPSLQLDAKAGCLKSPSGKELNELFIGGAKLLGSGTYQGYQVAKVLMNNPAIEMWYAPALGCEIIYQSVRYSDAKSTGTSTKELLKAKVGEPDPQLFDLSPEVKEMAPSSFAVSLASRCNRSVAVENFAEEDKRYFLNRP